MKKFRILHIGNIANNAYLNSKFLREKDIESDVLCYDYYHVMGCPEWEEVALKGDYGSDFDPDWSKTNLGDFKRPDWFYQGPLNVSAQNILNKNSDKPKEQLSWNILDAIGQKLMIIQSFCYKIYSASFKNPQSLRVKFLNLLKIPMTPMVNLMILYVYWAKEQLLPKKVRLKRQQYFKSLIYDFKNYFPDRKDRLRTRDILTFLYRSNIFDKLFQNYDIVQGYASDPIFPLLAGKHPYIAFEHGTIRDLPFENSSIGRLTALAYRKADLVFITNSDNLAAAKKLGLTNYAAIPHPVIEKWHNQFRLKALEDRKKYKEKILFCPVRHDWEVKGTNLYIEAMPEIFKRSKYPLRFVMVEWGENLNKSKKLLKDIGFEKKVIWEKAMPRWKLAYWMEMADIVLDQLILPAMGATAPEAMLAAKPVIASYRHEICKWMYPVKPPIVTAYNKEEVTENIIFLLNNPAKAKKIGEAGQKWFKRYHSVEILSKKTLANYHRVLSKYHAEKRA
jgi:glycosyltransferase involved in cell wall biosynthesis